MRRTTPLAAIAAGCLLAWVRGAGAAAVEVEGGRIAYETCGTGPKTVVLLHDGVLPSAAWDAAWPGLCARFRVVRYDRRGYGGSPAATAPYRPIDDLAAVMTAAGVERAMLVGASAGGGIAVEYALAHPRDVEGLVLVGPWVSGFGASYGFVARNLKLLALFKLGAVSWATRDRYILTKGAKAERRQVAALVKANPGGVTAGAKERASTVARPRLGEITTPTLVLTGAGDHADVRGQADAIAAAVPGARRVTIEDSGHFLYLERPEAFVEAVAAFVPATATSPGS